MPPSQVFFHGPPLLKGGCMVPSHGDDFSALQSAALKTAVPVWPMALSPFMPPDSLMVRLQAALSRFEPVWDALSTCQPDTSCNWAQLLS